MKISTLNILKTLANNYPDTTVFRKNVIESTARDMGYTGKDFVPLLTKEARVKNGTYDLTPVMPKPEPVVEASQPNAVMRMVASVTNSEKTCVEVDPTFVA